MGVGKGKSPQIWKFYKVEGDKLVRLRKECPRCGRGTFLAHHKERLHCGKCGYSEFLKK